MERTSTTCCPGRSRSPVTIDSNIDLRAAMEEWIPRQMLEACWGVSLSPANAAGGWTAGELLSVIDLMDEELRPARVSAGDVIYPPGGRFGPRRQHGLQLVLVHQGSVTVHIDGQARPPQGEGSVGLLLPGHREDFIFATTRSTRHSWVQANLADPPPMLLARLAALPVAIPASTALTELVGEAVVAARSPLSTATPLLGALAAAAFWRYAGDAESGVNGSDHDVIGRARSFLHNHVADPELDLQQVAAAAHVTPPHLVRRFRAELGVTPMAYLWQRRVAAGIDLLVHTGLPVGDVAARAGFKSVYHFSRKVREQTGLPPTELRQESWESR
jgi:AraC-like DNA-binding protein